MTQLEGEIESWNKEISSWTLFGEQRRVGGGKYKLTSSTTDVEDRIFSSMRDHNEGSGSDKFSVRQKGVPTLSYSVPFNVAVPT